MKDYTLSFSSIKEFAKSPAHFLAYKNKEKKESSAMRFGTAVHCAVLEPERFKNEYQTTTLRKGTKAHTALCEENPSVKFLNSSDWDSIKKIRDNIWKNELCQSLIDNADKVEQHVKGEIAGVKFQGYVDVMSQHYLIDLKTTSNSSKSEFERSAYNFKYYLQATIYRELTGIDDFWIIAVENVPPYNVTPFLLPPYYLEKGYVELMKLIKEFKKWDGKTGSYLYRGAEDFYKLDAPKWAK